MPSASSKSTCPCALKILSVSVDHRLPPPGHLVRTAFLPVFEAAAVEYFEGRATLYGGSYSGRTLVLEIAPHAQLENAWTLWLDDCEEGPFKPQIYWRCDENGDRGPHHAKISQHIHAALKQSRAESLCRSTEAVIELRADISALSAHQKMSMLATHRRLLA